MSRIAIGSPAVSSGIGLFETMLVVRGRVIQREEHCARMIASAGALGFAVPSPAALEQEIMREAARSAGRDEAALRCVWVASGYDLGDTTCWTLTASSGALSSVTLSRREHGRVITLDAAQRRALPEHKLTSYAACVVALRSAVAQGADEALFVAHDGSLLEGTSTNLFAVARKTLITAPLAAGVLPGIVRQGVIAIATRSGYTVEERSPTIDEVRRGAFLTSSLTLLAPVRAIDGYPCDSPGHAFAELATLWRERFLASS